MSMMGDNNFGDGQFGGTPAGTAIKLHVVPGSKAALALTLGWDPVPNTDAYRLYRNGVATSFSWDGTKTSWRVAYKDGDQFEVVAYKKFVGGQITV